LAGTLRFLTQSIHPTAVRCQELKYRSIIRCMENIRLRIGKRIKELRKKRGLTQEKLSEVADIDYKYIQRLEGKNPPALKVDTVERLICV